jgi:tetratricopeptide (TPR) repeat protein
LLSAEEQTAFLRLTVCVGSFSREAAQRVSAASLRALLKLADKSWLQAVAGGRFQLHELMRQYGAERLQADAATWRAAKQQHAEYFADFVAKQTRHLWSAQQLAGLKALDEEFASNLQAAWEWLVAERQWSVIIEKILPGLYTYGNIRNRLDALMAWFRVPRQMLDAQAADHEQVARAIFGTIEVSAEESLQIKDDNPVERLTRLWGLVQTHQLAEPMGFWFVMLAGLVLACNIDPAAEALLEDAVARVRRQNNPYLLGISLLMQSSTGGDFSFDEAKVREAERLFQEIGVIYEQGMVAWRQGQRAGQQKRPPAEIIRLVNQSEAFFEQAGVPFACNAMLLAGMYIQQNQIDELFAHLHRDEQAMAQVGNVRFLGSLLQWESLYAARYSTFAHALDTRQRGLALALKANVQSDVVFQYFELGDIYRIFGQPDRAQELYAQARAGFEKMGFTLGLAYCERAHGDLALAAGRYAEALTHYQAFMRYAQQDNHTWSVGQAHAKLALAHAHLHDPRQARSDMRQAITDMREWGQDEIELLALLAEVVCLLHEQQPEPSAELAAFIAHHHVSWNETKQHARALLETASRELPAERAQAAIERGQALALESVIDKLLNAKPHAS